MSWINRINNIKLTITTGDGKTYQPLWKNASKSVSYNAEGFDFVGVEGTYVQREKKSGTQYPIELYFTGENCIDESTAFEISARDSRAWVIKHPYYDEIRVQPLSLEIDDSGHNTSKVLVTVWETLTEKFPQQKELPDKQIQVEKLNSDAIIQDAYEVRPDTSIIQKVTDAVDSIDLAYKPLAATNKQAQELKQLASAAKSAAIDIVSAPLNFIREVQALINFPFTVAQDVKNKVNQLIDSANALIAIFVREDSNDVDLATYEALISTTLTEMARVTTDPEEGDLTKRKDVVEILDLLSNKYQDVLGTYDSVLYAQDPNIALSVDLVINDTLSNLNEIAFNSQQERAIFLEKDSNVILLAHRFYGSGDDNVDRFIDENEISRSELLQVLKGRRLIWYV